MSPSESSTFYLRTRVYKITLARCHMTVTSVLGNQRGNPFEITKSAEKSGNQQEIRKSAGNQEISDSTGKTAKSGNLVYTLKRPVSDPSLLTITLPRMREG